jgi:hypothetical protein
MPEVTSHREHEPKRPLADLVGDVFERRASRGDRSLILDTYKEKFEQLVNTLPKEQQDTLTVQIQKVFVAISGTFAEYGARIGDFIRNVTVWPMIKANKDFPKDVYYQIGLARAQAWGEFAMRTTKTATKARMAYRDKFLPSAATGGFMGAVGVGVYEGLTKGALVAGVQGAAIGAVAGGIIGGGMSAFLQLKDKVMGPPVLFFDLNGPIISGSVTKTISDNMIGGNR